MQNGRPKPKNEPAGAETQKIREMGIFRSPKFRITCIIRNSYNQKKKLPFSLSVRFPAASVDAFQFAYACIYTAGRITSMFKRSTYACGGCSGALPVMLYKQYRFFCCSFQWQRFCAKVRTDGFVINTRHSLAALLAAKSLYILDVCHKALF